MTRSRNIGPLFALCVLAAGLVRADSTTHEVVTNPPTAVSATMSSTTDANGCTTWSAAGKVSPRFRSEGGTSVRLVCTPFCELNHSCPTPPPTLSFPPRCDTSDTLSDASGNCSGVVDSCGNFSFNVATTCAQPPQLDPGYFCVFVVNTDVARGSPQSCNGKSTGNLPPPTDPNGSAPCSGGYCPSN